MFNKRERAFIADLKLVFDSPAGHRVLKALKETYINNSALAATQLETGYKLGEKELVQRIINYLKLDEKLEEVIINQADY